MIRRSLDCMTIGGATRDIMFYTSEGTLIPHHSDPLRETLIGFEYGAKITSRNCYFMLGGGGCNVAVGLSRLGLNTAAVLAVGDDRDGDALLRELEEEKVQTFAIKRHPRLRTGFSFVVVSEPTGEHVAFLYRGANDLLTVTRAELQRKKTRWIYLSSLGASAWHRIAPVLLDVVEDRPIKLAWNPGEQQLALGYAKLRPMLERADVLLLNKDEALELALSSGMRMSLGLKRTATLAKVIQRFGPQLVAVTEGAKGAVVYNGHEILAAPAIRTKVINTTGAGDAFGSGFVAGLRLFHDLHPALRLALKNSASVCTRIGAQEGLLHWSKLRKQFERHRV